MVLNWCYNAHTQADTKTDDVTVDEYTMKAVREFVYENKYKVLVNSVPEPTHFSSRAWAHTLDQRAWAHAL